MVKWIFRLLLISIVGLFGYVIFESYQKGYFSIPDMPDGSYVFSYKSGMRGIVLDAEVLDPSIADMPQFFRRIAFANPERSYFAVPFQVAPWMQTAWSTCTAPTEEERVGYAEGMPEDLKQNLAYSRFEAVCRITVDGEVVVRGLLYSVPKL